MEPRLRLGCALGVVLTVRRAAERRSLSRGARHSWQSFGLRGARAEGFGSLEGLAEERLAPGARLSAYPNGAVELITYVREGALDHRDSLSGASVLRAGEFQRLTLCNDGQRAQTHASTREGAQLFVLRLRLAQQPLDAGCERRRFSAAMRRGALCTIGSPDPHSGSLHLHLDALIYSVILAPGQHLAHELRPGRGAWLQLLAGAVSLGGVMLEGGDGAGLLDERAVSLTARDESELLIVELGGMADALPRTTGHDEERSTTRVHQASRHSRAAL